MKTMPVTTATDVARNFVQWVNGSSPQWTIHDVHGELPPEWSFKDGARESDFYPVTIEHVTRALRQWAKPAVRRKGR
jgi:hypothetical protein